MSLTQYGRFARTASWSVLALCWALGCTGRIGDARETGSLERSSAGDVDAGSSANARGDTPSEADIAKGIAFACDPKAPQSAAALRRLTMTQYENSMRELVSWAVNGDDTLRTTIMGELDASLAALPDDRREPMPDDLRGSYRRLDQSLQQNHVDSIYALAVATGAALTARGRLEVSVGACATDADAQNDTQCLEDFVRRFGERVLRKPLASDDVDFYVSVYGTDATADPAAYADVIGIMLNAPESVYFVEHGEQEVAKLPGVYTLSAFELASRLSFHLCQSSPDDELLAAAADGSLLDDEVYSAQVDRLLAQPCARPTLREFFADWAKVEDLPALDAKNQDPVFRAFAADDLPAPTLRAAMIDDVLGLLEHYTWKEPSAVSTFFTTEASFARDADLARIYGVPVWDGNAEPPLFPKGERPGLLTRALFLSTGSPNTRPIMKGVFMRKNILCDDIPPPPPGANAKPPELRSDMTTREVVEELTQTKGTVCASCHATIINPLGFATENFDALGRLRDAQRLFEADGTEVESKPIDTHTTPQIFSGDESESSGPADIMPMIADSGKIEACFARNYFRFTYARWEDTQVDGCALEASRKALAKGGSVLELVKAAVSSPEFRQRVFE